MLCVFDRVRYLEACSERHDARLSTVLRALAKATFIIHYSIIQMMYATTAEAGGLMCRRCLAS